MNAQEQVNAESSKGRAQAVGLCVPALCSRVHGNSRAPPRARFVVSTQGARGAVLTRRQVDSCPQAAAPLPVARSSFEVGGCKFDSYRVEPWPIESREIVDTTGAGDAFIGGCLHALVRGQPIEEMLSVGSYVASRKLRGVGARSTLPIARDLQDTMNAWTRRLPLRS